MKRLTPIQSDAFLSFASKESSQVFLPLVESLTAYSTFLPVHSVQMGGDVGAEDLDGERLELGVDGRTGWRFGRSGRWIHGRFRIGPDRRSGGQSRDFFLCSPTINAGR